MVEILAPVVECSFRKFMKTGFNYVGLCLWNCTPVPLLLFAKCQLCQNDHCH